MKHTLRNQILFFCPTLALGLASLWLHGFLVTQCIDDRGLLLEGSWPGRLLWVIGGVLGVYLLLLLRTIGGTGTYEDNFPKSILGGLLAIAGGAVMVPAVREMTFDAQWQLWLGYGAAASMAVTGIFRWLGRRPAPLFHGVVCLFFILVLLNNYRFYSADPQLQDYAYQLLAGILLMLASFHRTCCDAGMVQRKKLLFTGLAAAFCCLASLGTDFIPRFYLAAALWAMGSLCAPGQLPPDPEPVEEPAEPAPAADGADAPQPPADMN